MCVPFSRGKKPSVWFEALSERALTPYLWISDQGISRHLLVDCSQCSDILHRVSPGGFKYRRNLMRFLLVLALATAPACWAGLIGNVVGAQRLFPDTATVVADLGTQTVGAGIEFTNILQIDFSDNQIRFSADFPSLSSTHFSAASFNGYRFDDVNGTIPAVSSVTVDAASNLAGFDAGRLTVNSNGLFVNLQDLTFFGPASPNPLTNLILECEFRSDDGSGTGDLDALRRRDGGCMPGAALAADVKVKRSAV